MADWLDVTVPLVPGRVPLYPGDTPLIVEQVQARAAGDTANVSKLQCSLHCGTHVDGPAHYLDGADGVDTVPLDALIGPAYVVDARDRTGHVDAAALAELHIPADAERVLFRTRNSARWADPSFTEDFLAVTADAAAALVDRGVRLVGVDYLSVAPYDAQAPTHDTLLAAGVAVVEDLDLRAAEPGWYDLVCLPLRIPGADGAPARVLLRPR